MTNFIFVLLLLAVQSNRAIGTGRVGPRQTAFQPTYPSAQQELEHFPTVNHFNQQPPPQQPIVPNTPYYYQQPPPQFQQQPQSFQTQNIHQATHYAAPETILYDNPPRVQLSRPLNDARPNLQDRLARHRQPMANNANGVTPDNLQPSDIGQIAVGY